MPTTKANNINIYYELHGQGTPLVLISGFAEDHTTWEDVVRELAKSFQVLVFDNRGAGQTTSPKEPFTTEKMAEDTLALMRNLNISQAHILGHSMGGAIAQHIAIHHPEFVRRLILVCSAAKFDAVSVFVLESGEKLVDAGVSYPLLIENALPWIFGGAFLFSTEKLKKIRAKKLNNPHPQSLEGYKNQIRACTQHNTLHQLEKIKVHTLVLTTGNDLLVAPSNSKVLTARISGAELVTLPDVGHIPQVEAPDLFCKTINSFLSS